MTVTEITAQAMDQNDTENLEKIRRIFGRFLKGIEGAIAESK